MHAAYSAFFLAMYIFILQKFIIECAKAWFITKFYIENKRQNFLKDNM